MEGLVSAMQQAWLLVPFPFIFLFIIAIALSWLWFEHQTTRMSRRMPRWRQPIPAMPALSAFAVVVIRVLRVVLWLWVILFLVLTLTLVATQAEADIPPELSNGVGGVANVWRQGYGWITRALPDGAPDWLQSSP